MPFLFLIQTTSAQSSDNQKKSMIHQYFAAIDGPKDSTIGLAKILSPKFIIINEQQKLNSRKDLEAYFVKSQKNHKQYHFPRIFKIEAPLKIKVIVHFQ